MADHDKTTECTANHDLQESADSLPLTAPQEKTLFSGTCRTMFEGVGFGVILVDPETRKIVEANSSVLRMLQMRKEDVVGRVCHKFICPAEQGKCPVLDLGRTVDLSERVLCRNSGICMPVLKSVVPAEFRGRKVLLESLVDITALKEAQEALRVSEQRYALAAQGANDGLWDWDLKAHTIYYSDRWKAMLGYEAGEITPSADEWFLRVHPDDVIRLKTEIDHHLDGDTSHLEIETRMRHKDEVYRWFLIRAAVVRDQTNTPLRMAGSATDITERKQVEDELRRGAFFDSLTGLANRALFIDRLERCFARAQRQNNYYFSVLFLDLDRFKVVNDSLGHQMGDRLLAAVAARLHTCLRSSDTAGILAETPHTVARIGGDEFTVLLDDIKVPDDAVLVAERIRKALRRPFEVDGQEVYTAVSIGIATYDGTTTTATEMLRDADTALYRAKAAGRGRYEIFDHAMHTQAVDRMELDRDLRRAIERKQFVVHYQPIVQLTTGRVKGFEALVRWNHPERGMIMPADFILVAEELGLLVPIGWFVLQEACGQIKQWQNDFPSDPPLTMAVNMASLQIRQLDLVPHVLAILKETGVSPSSLEIEITESTLLQNDDHTLRVLNQLKKAGISLHMDDFGTGYSSLSYLSHFPIDVVKIDRSFISSLQDKGKQDELVDAILTMAQAMGIRVIAEGIESEAQRERLRELACGYGQGFLFARPMAPADVEELLVQKKLSIQGSDQSVFVDLGASAEQFNTSAIATW
jgi:diguanylate cyclase (GGDEF)-like protein/PAS domain S-box-containing protein